MALLKDDALLASTSVFIPFIIIPPMAATPWIIAKVGIALLFLIPSPDVALALASWYLVCLTRVPVKYD